jgi:hypothetical protein
MKPASLTLFELINTLSSSEKRYLKLGFTDKKSEHLKLFDAIVKQQQYDEEALKKQYSESRFAKNLPVYKAYLYKYILNKLDGFHEKGEAASVFECIRFAELLMQKKLVKQAAGQLKKAQKLALKFGLSDMLLVVTRMQQEILAQGNRFDFTKSSNLYQLRNSALSQLNLNNEYTRLFSEISNIQIRIQKAQKPEDFQVLEQWRAHPLLQKQPDDLYLPDRVLLLKSMAVYHFTRDEANEASQFNKKILELLERESGFNKKYPEQYLSALNNFIIDQLSLKNIPAFEEGLNRLEQVPDNPAFAQVKNIKPRMFHQRYLLFFNYCFAERDYAKATLEMYSFEIDLERFKDKLPFHQRLTLHYLAGVLCFGARQFGEAQKWLFPILQETSEDVVPEIFRHARMLNLLVHFELGHFEYLESLLLSTQRMLLKKRQMSSAEKMLLRFLKKSTLMPGRKVMSEERAKLKLRLEELAIQPKRERLFEYIHLVEWIEAVSEKY